MFVPSASGGAHAATAPAPPFVTLQGEGAWSTFEEIVPWHNQLATAKSPIALSYTPTGSFIGRQDLLVGSADFAISGVAPTSAQLAAAKHKSTDFIAAPVAAASLGILVLPPAGSHPGFQSFVVRCDPLADPSTWPPDVTNPFDPVHGCQIWTKYQGAVRIPNDNLAAMLLQYQLDESRSPIGEPMSSWNNGTQLQALGVANLASVPPKKGPTPVLRSDADETNYFVQDFTSKYAPSVWSGLAFEYPTAKWRVDEALPRQASASRGEADQQAEMLGPKADPASGAVPFGGAIADVPPSAIIALQNTYPNTSVSFAELKNANGDWIGPTPDSITKAIAAAGNTPLYAFGNKVPGAYPFTWVDNLYAPAHGLSVAKTEGLATLVRYLATAGQDASASVGEGRISSALQTQAFAAADKIVASNCVGSDRKIQKTSDPGALAPAGASGMSNIGEMLHCVAVAPVASTTTTSTTIPLSNLVVNNAGGSSLGGGTPSLGGSSSASGTATGTVSGTSSSPPTGSSAPLVATNRKTVVVAKPKHSGGESPLEIASKLPLPLPGQGSGFDRLGAFVLGALLYFVLRRPVGSAVRGALT
jgi:hypothetical protein